MAKFSAQFLCIATALPISQAVTQAQFVADTARSGLARSPQLLNIVNDDALRFECIQLRLGFWQNDKSHLIFWFRTAT